MTTLVIPRKIWIRDCIRNDSFGIFHEMAQRSPVTRSLLPSTYEIFMTTSIITTATISLYFVMGVSGGAEFLNTSYSIAKRRMPR